MPRANVRSAQGVFKTGSLWQLSTGLLYIDATCTILISHFKSVLLSPLSAFQSKEKMQSHYTSVHFG